MAGEDGEGVGYIPAPLRRGDESSCDGVDNFRRGVALPLRAGEDAPLLKPSPTPRINGCSSATFKHNHFQTSSLIRGPFPVV